MAAHPSTGFVIQFADSGLFGYGIPLCPPFP